MEFDIYTVMVILMIIDYLTGILKAVYTKSLNSYISYKGLIKKFCIIIVIILSYLIDLSLPSDTQFLPITFVFYITTEIVSILENLIAMDIPLPDFIVEKFNKEKN